MSTELIPHRGKGRPRNAERDEYRAANKLLRERYAAKAPDAQENLFNLADGIWVEETVEGEDGTLKRRVYKTAPNYFANQHIIERVMGRVSNTADVALAEARTTLIEQQTAANFYMWQAQFLKAQAEGKAIENEQWPKQFVSEEEVNTKIQVLAASLNRPLLQMTPELWDRFKSSENGLEEMKAYLGRSQAEVYREVMESEDAPESEEEGESDEG